MAKLMMCLRAVRLSMLRISKVGFLLRTKRFSECGLSCLHPEVTGEWPRGTETTGLLHLLTECQSLNQKGDTVNILGTRLAWHEAKSGQSFVVRHTEPEAVATAWTLGFIYS